MKPHSSQKRKKDGLTTRPVRLDCEVMAKLAEMRTGFETPNDVIRRVLNLPRREGGKDA